MCIDINTVLQRQLTSEQRAAAIDPGAEVLCLACAGSGKSRTLAYRIAWLIAGGATPQSIVAFTFTEKAAESIKWQVGNALAASGLEPTILGAILYKIKFENLSADEVAAIADEKFVHPAFASD